VLWGLLLKTNLLLYPAAAKQEHIDYWLKTAAHDWEVAQSLFEHGKYDWCLFVAHLVIEKVLKAFWVRDSEKAVPQIHNLLKLVHGTRLALSFGFRK
jgi:HEPN domain-containing protein